MIPVRHKIGTVLFLGVCLAVGLRGCLPAIRERFPVRVFVRATRDVDLYDCRNYPAHELIGMLEAGQKAEMKGIVDGLYTHYIVELSDGRQACYSMNDEENVEWLTYNFYYF